MRTTRRHVLGGRLRLHPRVGNYVFATNEKYIHYLNSLGSMPWGDVPGDGHVVAVGGRPIFITDADAVHTIDVPPTGQLRLSDPHVEELSGNGLIADAVAIGDRLVVRRVVDFRSTIVTYDVSDLGAPQEVAQWEMSAGRAWLAASDRLVVASSESEVLEFDPLGDGTPQAQASVSNLGRVLGIVGTGGRAITAHGYSEMDAQMAATGLAFVDFSVSPPTAETWDPALITDPGPISASSAGVLAMDRSRVGVAFIPASDLRDASTLEWIPGVALAIDALGEVGVVARCTPNGFPIVTLLDLSAGTQQREGVSFELPSLDCVPSMASQLWSVSLGEGFVMVMRNERVLLVDTEGGNGITELQSLDWPYYGPYVDGTLLYFVDEFTQELVLVDVSDATAVVELVRYRGAWQDAGSPYYAHGRMYIPDATTTHVLDITDPTSPQPLSPISGIGFALVSPADFLIGRSRSQPDAVVAYDLRAGHPPAYAGTVTGVTGSWFAVTGNAIVTASTRYGLRVWMLNERPNITIALPFVRAR